MKRLNIILFALLGMFVATSCTDEKDPVIGDAGNPVLKALTTTTYVLDKEKAAMPLAKFEWTRSDWGINVAIQSKLQVDLEGSNFAKPTDLMTCSEDSVSLTVGDLNKEMMKRNLAVGSAAKLQFRVVSSIQGVASKTYTKISNLLTLTVTPYSDAKVYPMIYTPGNHQGWSPATSQPLYSLNNNTTFEGYVKLDGGFKFASQPSWGGPNYGAGATAGTLDANGGDLTSTAGYFYATVDTKALTYVLKPMAWAVIGSATPVGWNDTPLVYDAATKTLRVDLVLVDGVIKFRANGSWDDNFGMPKGGSIASELKPGGDDIPVTAGNYTIVLDLSTPTYKATLIKK